MARRIRAGLVSSCVVAALVLACSDDPTGTDDVVATVEVQPSLAEFVLGDSVLLTAVPKNRAGREIEGKEVEWSSDNPDVLRVSGAGWASGLRAGSGRVLATVDGITGSTQLTVTPYQDPAATGPVTATVSPAGGTITAVTDDGTLLRIDFPENAVLTETEVTLRPLSPRATDWFRVAVEPADLPLGRPAQVTATLPRWVDLTDIRLMLGDGTEHILLPTTVQASARRLTTSLGYFGAPPFSGTGSAAGLLASFAQGKNELSAATVDCQAVLNQVKKAFDDWLGIGQYEHAVNAAIHAATAMQLTTCPGMAEWVASAQTTVCQGLANVVQAAAQAPTTNLGDFIHQTEPILHWGGIQQTLAAECDISFRDALAAEAVQYLEFVSQRLATLSMEGYAQYLDLRDEAQSAFELTIKAAQLALYDEAEMIKEGAILPAGDRMRLRGYELCRSDGWHYPLSRLTTTGFFAARDIIGFPSPRPGPLVWPPPSSFFNFSDDDIYRDLQYCATELTFAAITPADETLASMNAGTGGAPGSKVSEFTLDTPTRGKLRIDGEILGFTCWGDIHADNEIAISLEGTPILSLNRAFGGGYLNGEPIELDIEELIQQTGIVAREGFAHDVTFERKRLECDERLWGPQEFELITATLSWKNPTLEVTISLPETVTPETETTLEVRVRGAYGSGTFVEFENVDVELEITGGSAALTQGKTGEDGVFRTTITAPLPDPSPGQLTVRAVAKSVEQVTAEAVVTVPVEELAIDPPAELELDFGTGEPNPTVQGPVLRQGIEYRILVSGTFSIWTGEWAFGACKGFPAAGEGGPTGLDAEYWFAIPGGSTLCGGSFSCCPNHHSKFRWSLDNGADFDHEHPVVREYNESHSYEYRVIGEGTPILFMLEESSSRGDDYGILHIRIEQVTGVP